MGKSVGLIVELLLLAIGRGVAVLCLDRPGSLARDMVGHLCANGIEHRTIFEEARRTDKVLRWPFIKNSRKEGYAGEIENELEDERFLQPFLATRNLRVILDKPYTKEFSDAGSAIFRSRNAEDLRQLLDPFMYPDIRFVDAIQQARDEVAARVFQRLALRSKRSQLQFDREAGAARRLFELVNSPVLYLRHGQGISWRELLNRKYQIYFDLSGITAESARALSIFAVHAAINACREHFDETGEPLHVVIVLEEAGVMDLVTPFVLDAMRELRKAGVVVWVVSQTLTDFDPQVLETLLGLANTHIFYRINSGVDRAAKLLSDPTWDSHEVHYTRDRIVSDGVEQVKTVSKGKSSSQNGNSRIDEREGVAFVAKQRVVIEEYYKTSQMHEQDWKTALVNLNVGQRIVHDMLGVRKETVEMAGPPWPLGLTKTRLPDALERLRNCLHFSEVCRTTQKSPRRLGERSES